MQDQEAKEKVIERFSKHMKEKKSFFSLKGVLPYTLFYFNEAIFELSQDLYQEFGMMLYKETLEIME